MRQKPNIVGRKLGRPTTTKPKRGEPTHLSVNLDGSIVLALDEEAERRTTGGGPVWTRTDVLRNVIAEWLGKR